MTEADDGGANAGGLRTSLLGRLSRLGMGGLKHRWAAMARTVEHRQILVTAHNGAQWSLSYAFMLVIAAGIASIGLLLDSPAVIIGAMLVSPLMGPIVGSGFALATIDVDLGRRAARALLIGALVAVGVAMAITALSPVTEPTAEILARTRPSLFDLAVAIFSGAAGAYALVRGQGGAIVGVAIATALMPPLAVVGYGLATWQWGIARGAMLLFVTNMCAISVAVSAMAVWYGFARGDLRHSFARQAAISVLVLAPLALPLAISLRSIAWEARSNVAIRSILAAEAARLPQGELAQVQVRFDPDQKAFVSAILVSRKPRPGLEQKVTETLRRELGSPVTLRLTQLHADDPDALAVQMKGAVAAPVPTAVINADFAASLRAEIPFAVSALQVDTIRREATIIATAQPGVDLPAWRDLETVLTQHHAGWSFTLVPPFAGLAPIEFANGEAALTAKNESALSIAAWALQRWGVRELQLSGYASSRGGGPRSLAGRRVTTVAEWLRQRGFVVTTGAHYPVARQLIEERERGESAFRTVEISLRSPTAAGPKR